jgi:hypothetical protein
MTVQRWDEYTIEKYYNRVQEHLKDLGVWEQTIVLFPPETIRHIIQKILERLDEYDMDYELLDWGVLFEGLRDFKDSEAFLKHLEALGEIPPPKEQYTQDLLAQYEKELKELGYRIVKEESYLKYLTSKEKDEEVNRLKRKIAEYERKIAELEKALATYERTRQIPPEYTPPPTIKTAKTTIYVKQLIPYNEFLEAIKTKLNGYGLPPEYIDNILKQYEPTFRNSYETLTQEQLAPFLEELFNWLISEVMKPPEYTVYDASTLKVLLGENAIRTPRPEKKMFMGQEIETYPSIERLKDKFQFWANSIEKVGWKIEYKPIVLQPGYTNIIHTKRVGEPLFLVYNNMLLGSDEPIIAYNYYEHVQKVEMYFYRSIGYIITALTMK